MNTDTAKIPKTHLQYTGMALDRGDALRRDADHLEALWQTGTCRVLPILNNRHLFTLDASGTQPPLTTIPAMATINVHLENSKHRTFLGHHDDIAYFTAEISDHVETALCAQFNGKFIDLRSVGAQLDHATASLLAYARAMIHWRSQNQFCALCAGSLNILNGGHILQCSNAQCAKQVYPRTDPAVIMLVERTDERGVRQCLLGSHPQWHPKAISTLAGFVEPGETLEDAVRREVNEESGVTVGKVTYITSQPWPFPSSIMLGFFAEALNTEITLDPHELAEAAWFSKADLLTFGEWGEEGDHYKLPRHDSIARFLINKWLVMQD